MFDSRLYNLEPVTPQGPAQVHTQLLHQAVDLFNQARHRAIFRKWIGFFFKRAQSLVDLDLTSGRGLSMGARMYAGVKAVNIDQICGTLGRANDFDASFYPLRDNTRDRWVSIALARSLGIALAPVELIQIGERYFVKDGHHRISVARVLGEIAVDAEVTVWQVNGPLPWDCESTEAVFRHGMKKLAVE